MEQYMTEEELEIRHRTYYQYVELNIQPLKGSEVRFAFYIEFGFLSGCSAADALTHLVASVQHLVDGKYRKVDDVWWTTADHSVVFCFKQTGERTLVVDFDHSSRPAMLGEANEVMHALIPIWGDRVHTARVLFNIVYID